MPAGGETDGAVAGERGIAGKRTGAGQRAAAEVQAAAGGQVGPAAKREGARAGRDRSADGAQAVPAPPLTPNVPAIWPPEEKPMAPPAVSVALPLMVPEPAKVPAVPMPTALAAAKEPLTARVPPLMPRRRYRSRPR